MMVSRGQDERDVSRLYDRLVLADGGDIRDLRIPSLCVMRRTAPGPLSRAKVGQVLSGVFDSPPHHSMPCQHTHNLSITKSRAFPLK